jgi:protein-tyrosine phosphatase
MPTSHSFTILTVCTGNICRSPATELLLSAQLDDSVQVGSAGTHAAIGMPMPELMADLLTQAGENPSAFGGSRQLSSGMVQNADLILVMTRRHRAQVVELVPDALRRTFTLQEFARLAGAVNLTELASLPTSAARLARIVALAPTLRPIFRARRGEIDDIPDPYGQSPAAYEHAMSLIKQAVQTIAIVVRP